MAHEVLLLHDGWPAWRLADGRIWPLIAGGSAGPGSGDGGGAGGGGDGGDGGQGGGSGGTSGGPAGTAGAPGTGGRPAGSAADTEWSDDWKPEDARRTFKTLRDIAQKAEREAREARQALESRSREGMTEAERAQARARELEQQVTKYQEQVRLGAMREAFREAGTAAKARNPATIWKLIDRDSIQWGPDGEVLNATELIRDLKRAEPWAFEGQQRTPAGSADAAQGAGQAPAHAGQKDQGNKAFNDWFRTAAGRGG